MSQWCETERQQRHVDRMPFIYTNKCRITTSNQQTPNRVRTTLHSFLENVCTRTKRCAVSLLCPVLTWDDGVRPEMKVAWGGGVRWSVAALLGPDTSVTLFVWDRTGTAETVQDNVTALFRSVHIFPSLVKFVQVCSDFSFPVISIYFTGVSRSLQVRKAIQVYRDQIV